MARTKGSKNKNSTEIPVYTAMPTDERIGVLDNLIVDRIFEDQNAGGILLQQLVEQGYGTDTA